MPRNDFLSPLLSFFELTRVLLLAVALIIIVLAVVAVPLPVSGKSMQPNFQTGQVVLVRRLNPQNSSAIKRGDVVAAKFPADPNHTKLIKRVLGLPGDTIYASQGVIFINGLKIDESVYAPIIGAPPYEEKAALTLNDGEYFLVGDNRPGSSDSRLWGAVQRRDIQGKVAFVIWPPRLAHFVDAVGYSSL